MASDIKTVAVIGTGVLGTQIAIQSASFGYEVCAFDELEGAFERTSQGLLAAMAATEKKPVVDQAVWQESSTRIGRARHLEEAVAKADLVIESVPEKLELKRRIFSQVDALAPANAILATNSSTIPVSRMESATQRPSQLLNLHFYIPALGVNIVDIMGGAKRANEISIPMQPTTKVAWFVVYIPEVFPTEWRGACLGWVSTITRISYVLGALLCAELLILSPKLEWFWVFTGLLMLVPIIVVPVFKPFETTRKELELIEARR